MVSNKKMLLYCQDIRVEFTVYDAEFEPSQPITLHVAVRPSSTTAPRVIVNAGLTIIEGLHRPITPSLLRIVDSDNIEKVKVPHIFSARAFHSGGSLAIVV